MMLHINDLMASDQKIFHVFLFSLCVPCDPLGPGDLLPHGHNLNKCGRGL